MVENRRGRGGEEVLKWIFSPRSSIFSFFCDLLASIFRGRDPRGPPRGGEVESLNWTCPVEELR